MLNSVIRFLPGMIFCSGLALAGATLSAYFGGPSLLYALLLGMALHWFSKRDTLAPGIGFSSDAIMKAGVALLGIRISVEQVLALGVTPLVIVMVSIPATILFGVALSRSMGISKEGGILSGGAVAICGASAAMAIAAVLPQRPESERQLVFTVIGVTMLSTIAMLGYPLVSVFLGLPEIQAGLFLGGTIHNVPQAVGAGFTISEPAGDAATFIKLLRVAMLAPAVLLISAIIARQVTRQEHASTGGASVPGFLLVFAALVICNSLGWIPVRVHDSLDWLSRACLVVALAAIGLKASFRELIALGWRPVLLITLETLFLAVLVLGGLLLFS